MLCVLSANLRGTLARSTMRQKPPHDDHHLAVTCSAVIPIVTNEHTNHTGLHHRTRRWCVRLLPPLKRIWHAVTAHRVVLRRRRHVGSLYTIYECVCQLFASCARLPFNLVAYVRGCLRIKTNTTGWLYENCVCVFIYVYTEHIRTCSGERVIIWAVVRSVRFVFRVDTYSKEIWRQFGQSN